MQGGTAVCSMGANGRSFFGSPGSSDTVSCPEVSYVDDLALFISHDSPGKLCDRVTEIMASFGLELNMKAGKTECILSLRGRGTAEAQRQLARDGKQIILHTKYAKLCIVQSYCHLGIILTKTGCITPEKAKRCKAMLGAYLPIAHMVFASREICRSTKLQLAHALLDGILFHGAATWPELSEGCSARLEGVRCRVLRKSCQHFRGPDGDGWTDRQVRLECDLPRLEVVLAQSRLLLAARTARNAPDSLGALQVEAGQDGSWVQMLSRDNMRSLLPGQLSSIGSLEEAWNRVWYEHPRA